jgi:hypothetical protein
MPGGDRTGPTGMGPMTGRAAGYCAGYPAPGYANPAFGRGFGFGRGRGGGRGRRNWFYATGLTGWQRGAYGYPNYAADMSYNPPYAPPASELDALKGQAEYFGNALADIKKRIEELEKGAGAP